MLRRLAFTLGIASITAALWAYAAGGERKASGPAPSPAAAACGKADWACVAECIDRACAEKCLQRCRAPLDVLRRCIAREHCREDDPSCPGNRCATQCHAAFGVPPSRVTEKPIEDPCSGAKAPKSNRPLPKGIAGTWKLQAASLTRDEDAGNPAATVAPRADYDLILRIDPAGCFVTASTLDQATLGKDNELKVRSWGWVTVTGKVLTLGTQDGQVTGKTCGGNRVIGLAHASFQGPHFEYALEQDTLTLTALTPDKQAYQFAPADKSNAPKK